MIRKTKGEIIIPARCYPLSHEIRTANAFADNGETIQFIPPSNTYKGKNADVRLRGLIWEIKSPEGHSVDAIERNLKRACRQSPNIIFDCRRMKKVPVFIIHRELVKRAKLQRKIQHLIMVDKSGKPIDIK